MATRKPRSMNAVQWNYVQAKAQYDSIYTAFRAAVDAEAGASPEDDEDDAAWEVYGEIEDRLNEEYGAGKAYTELRHAEDKLLKFGCDVAVHICARPEGRIALKKAGIQVQDIKNLMLNPPTMSIVQTMIDLILKLDVRTIPA